MEKYPLDPARIRQLPTRFSWLDQRLVTEGHLRQCGSGAQGLYLFLAVVSDAQGLSYYADKSIRTHLGIEQEELAQARATLVAANLVIFQRPLYQLLSLDPWKSDSRERTGRALCVSDLIRVPELTQP
jgi:ABC-type cobalamin transport system ATPase subunit